MRAIISRIIVHTDTYDATRCGLLGEEADTFKRKIRGPVSVRMELDILDIEQPSDVIAKVGDVVRIYHDYPKSKEALP